MQEKGTYEDDNTNVTRREQQVDPAFDLSDLDVESGRDDTGFVQSSVKLDYDLSSTVIVDLFEFSDVSFRREISRIVQ